MTANGTLADCNVTIITIHLLNGNSKRNNSMSHSKDKLYLKLFSDEWETILSHLKSFYLSPNGTNCVSSITFQRSAINWRWTAPDWMTESGFCSKKVILSLLRSNQKTAVSRNERQQQQQGRGLRPQKFYPAFIHLPVMRRHQRASKLAFFSPLILFLFSQNGIAYLSGKVRFSVPLCRRFGHARPNFFI